MSQKKNLSKVLVWSPKRTSGTIDMGLKLLNCIDIVVDLYDGVDHSVNPPWPT